MKRYTARFASGDKSEDEVKRVLDRWLSRTALMYRFGRGASPVPGVTELQIATEADRTAMAEALRAACTNTGVQLESVAWGHDAEGAAGEAAPATDDPLAATPAQIEAARDYLVRPVPVRIFLVKQSLILAFVFWFLLGMIGFSIIREVLALAALGATLWYWRASHDFTLVAGLRLDPEGIEVRYWVWPFPRRYAWAMVRGLELKLVSGHGTLVTQRGRVDLPVTSPAAPADGLTIVKTIVERANLQFVEAVPLRQVTYRHPEAM